MRFLHTADWHIGKNLAGYSLLNDQEATFRQIEKIAKTYQVDAVVIAGDLYDRSIPNETTIKELNHQLSQLNLKDNFPILAISGNHDSATRLGVGSKWFKNHDFYLNTDFSLAFNPVIIKDTQFFLLPFFGLQQVRNHFADDSIKDINMAMKRIVKEMKANFKEGYAHVLVAHFFAAGSHRTAESETMIEVGGLSAVDTSLLNNFDYVALGHLHNKNALQGEERIKYSGSPMKFSVSEASMDKGVWIVDTNPFDIQWVSLTSVHDIHVLEDSMENLTNPQYAAQYSQDDFFDIRLTDRNVIPNAMSRLREYYPKILRLSRKYGFTNVSNKVDVVKTKKAPEKILTDFYEEVTNNPLDKDQKKWVRETLEEAEREPE